MHPDCIFILLYLRRNYQTASEVWQRVSKINLKNSDCSPAGTGITNRIFPFTEDSLNRVSLAVNGVALKKDTDFVVTQ